MAVIGFRAATAPLPGSDGPADPTCSEAEQDVKAVRAPAQEVQVSVFNAGRRGGLAGTTLEKVEDAGFKAGNAGQRSEGRQGAARRGVDDQGGRPVREAGGTRVRSAAHRSW